MEKTTTCLVEIVFLRLVRAKLISI